MAVRIRALVIWSAFLGLYGDRKEKEVVKQDQKNE